MLPWSVTATDFIPESLQARIKSGRRMAPSRRLYRVCRCRCVKSAGMGAFTSSRDPPSSVPEDVAERRGQVREPEAVAAVHRLARGRLLPVEEHFRHLSYGEPQRGPGHRKQRRPAQGAPQLAGELLHPRRVRRHRVDRTANTAVDGPEDDSHLVVDVDPGDPLLARPDGTSHERLEGRDHLLQRAVVTVEDDPGAEQDGADAELLRSQSLSLPLAADLREEVAARGRRLRHLLVAAAAAGPADGAGADEDVGFASGPRHRVDQRPRRPDAALPDLTLVAF